MQTSNPSVVIEVREATPDDYQGVLDISKNVYHGSDYVANKYHSLIKDPDFRYYVCLVDGEVGAFQGAYHLDDNKTLMLRSLRVKEKFQGQGLTNAIRRKMYDDYKDVPGVKRTRLGKSEESRFTRSKAFLSQHKLLKKQKRIQFKDIPIQHMDAVTTSDVETKPISWEEFRHVIQIQSVRDYLFPENLITSDFWIFDAIPSNVRHVQKQCQRVFISRDLYRFLPESDGNIVTETAANNNNNIDETGDENRDHNGDESSCPVQKGIMGIINSYIAAECFYMVITLSGNPTNGKEKEEIRSILAKSLAHAQSMYADRDSENRKLKFSIVCKPELPEELFHEVAEPFGLEPANEDECLKELYYFEQEFEKLLPPGKT